SAPPPCSPRPCTCPSGKAPRHLVHSSPKPAAWCGRPARLLVSLGASSLLGHAAAALAWAGLCALILRRKADVAGRGASLLLASLLLLTTAFFAHYLVPVVALVAVAGGARLEKLVMALSIGSLAGYSVELLSISMPPGWIGSAGYQALGSTLTLAPAAL